jgi:hypothetical protein
LRLFMDYSLNQSVAGMFRFQYMSTINEHEFFFQEALYPLWENSITIHQGLMLEKRPSNFTDAIQRNHVICKTLTSNAREFRYF